MYSIMSYFKNVQKTYLKQNDKSKETDNFQINAVLNYHILIMCIQLFPIYSNSI